MSRPATHILKDETTLHRAGAERVVAIANEALRERGAFHLALSGGMTPERLYRQLARHDVAPRIDWSRVHVYFGDERCVPADHHDSNYRMARETLLAHVPIPPAQIHRIEGEHPPEQAASDYADLIARTAPHGDDRIPQFDLVLLGVGLDGHVASLFPGTDILHKRKVSAASVFVPKLNACRVSLTLPVINHARHVLLLVAGAKKADVVRHVLRGARDAIPLPVQMLHPTGTVEWFLDADAARYLDQEPAS